MINNKKKITILISIISLILFVLTNNAFAITNPGNWEPNNIGGENKDFYAKSGIIIGYIQYIGILISVVVLSIIGVKYLFGSVEQKAEYKKTMMPYILGCFLLIGTVMILRIIANIAT